MPGPGAVLFNHETNSYEEVPGEQVSAAISSGKYTSSGGSTSTQGTGGAVARPVEQLGAAGSQGETDAGAINATRAAAQRLEERRQLSSDAVLSFVEGVGDAATLGLLHGASEEDELRREADSGSALLGQLVGTALGLKFPGPIRGVTAGGEKLGEGIARALLGEAETGFHGVVTRGLQEAGANAALMAASAFGHQITDSVIADKPFAAEAIASEAGYGALLGFGLGFAGSSFGQLAKASRGAVEASGVAIKESKAALDAVSELSRQWDDVVEQHAQRVGVLKVLAEDGHVPSDLHESRAGNLRRAAQARDALKAMDPVRALGGDGGEFQKWRNAVEEYQAAVVRLDDSMTPSMVERAHGSPVSLGSGADLGRPPLAHLDLDAEMADKGFRSPMSSELDHAMSGGAQAGEQAGKPWTEMKDASGADLRAKYRDIYGRDFEETPGIAGHAPEGAPLGSENLGGKVTPTSDIGTNPGVKRRPSQPPIESDTVVDPRVERFNKQPAKYRSPNDTVIDVTGQTVGPREVLKAGDAPAAQAETAADFVGTSKKELLGLPAGESEAPSGAGDGKKAVRDYLNNWFREYDSKPRVGLGDQLKTRLTQALDDIAKVSGGRLDSAGSLALLKALGIKESTSSLGQRLDQVWSLGQAGKYAADESRGIKTPLRRGLLEQIQRYATHKGARMVAGAMFGGAVGGPMGSIIGIAITSAGFAGRAAAAAGKLVQMVATAGDALLQGRRATLVARAVLGNRPYQYSDEGPITDPVQRIIDVQRMAANPQAIKARVMHQLGDLALTSPDVAQHLLDTTTKNIQAISASAPAIMLSPLGRPIKPSSTALNRFLDFENAMHNLPDILSAIAGGYATEAQIKALHIGYPAVHAELVRRTLGQDTKLDALEEAKLKTVERVLGVPLTRSSQDPTITSRFQGNWASPTPADRPAQSFKITAPKPTPVQASGADRAPGNERKP